MEIIIPTPRAVCKINVVAHKAPDRQHAGSECCVHLSSLPPPSSYCTVSSSKTKQALGWCKKRWVWWHLGNIFFIHFIFIIVHMVKIFLTGLRSQSNKIIHLNSLRLFVALGNFDVVWLGTLVCNCKFKYDHFPWSFGMWPLKIQIPKSAY